MRWWLGILFAFVVFSGCAYKKDNSPLNFAPYTPKNAPIIAGKTVQKIYLKSVVDKRESTSIVAAATNSSGEMIGTAVSATSIPLWLYESVKKGLEKRGIEVINTPQKDVKKVDMDLREFFSTYDGEIFEGKNMKAIMFVKLKIQDGQKTITKNISQSQNQWKGIVDEAADFKPFLQVLLNDITTRIIENIVKEL